MQAFITSLELYDTITIDKGFTLMPHELISDITPEIYALSSSLLQ